MKKNGPTEEVRAVEILKRQEVATLFEQRAQQLLGTSGLEALKMLKQGKLRGTRTGVELEMLRFLRDD